MYLFITVLHIVLSVFLIGVILLQPGKGGDVGSAFGGGGMGGGAMFGARGPASLLSRATTVVAIMFMMTSITLSMYSSKELLEGANESNLPTIPGVATISEAMTALDSGFNRLKLFPAEAIGGIDFLKAVIGPFPELKFCPTGGISLDNASKYLSLGNVFCVGGSWITPKELIKSKEWNKIQLLASESSGL